MSSECAVCHKQVEDYKDCFAVFRCRKDHIFRCCKVECVRIFEKRCAKVSDCVLKVTHKLNNDGHTSALRRLPPGEREKIKQHAEAEQQGLMVCPEDMKASERSLPHCVHMMNQIGGFGTAGQGPESTTRAEPGQPAPPLHAKGAHFPLIHDDDLLVVIKKDEDLDELEGTQKPKKGKKPQGNTKKGQTLILDWKTHSNEDQDIPLPTPAKAPPQQQPPARNPGGIGAAQSAWSAVASKGIETKGSGTAARRPADFETRIGTLAATTGCSELRAMRILEQHDWNLDRAADAFFQADREEVPKWGPRQTQETHVQSSSQVSQSDSGNEVAEVQAKPTPPAPSQPPPPPLPEGWQAIWCDSSAAYYYWHVATNHTTWDSPEVKVEVRDDAALIASVRNNTGLAEGAARTLLEVQGWDVSLALSMHAEAQRHELERQRQAQQRAEEEAAELRRQRAEQEREREREAKALQEEEDRKRLTAEAEAKESNSCGLGLHISAKNFRPSMQPGLGDCVRLLQGERVMVTWTDGQPAGWAYGYAVDTPRNEGYFPQAIAKEILRYAHPFDVGDQCTVESSFEAPEDISGYLPVERGDRLSVLYASEEPHVWVYCEIAEPFDGRPGTTDQRGWVPECLLTPLKAPKVSQGDVVHGIAPHPAG